MALGHSPLALQSRLPPAGPHMPFVQVAVKVPAAEYPAAHVAEQLLPLVAPLQLQLELAGGAPAGVPVQFAAAQDEGLQHNQYGPEHMVQQKR